MVPASSKFRLMVEGPDDKYCVIHLTETHGLDWGEPEFWMPHIWDCGGYDKLRNSLPIAFKTYSKLGVIVDSDPGTNRYESIIKALENTAIKFPELLPEEGLVVKDDSGTIRLGIWLMPDNQTDGTLEGFLSNLVPSEDARWDHAQESVTLAKEKGAEFPDNLVKKANLHTWLAWQREPGLRFGTAIKAGYFATDQQLVTNFYAWFENLFNPSRQTNGA